MSSNSDKEKFKKYLSFYNRAAKIEHKGKSYSVNEQDIDQLNIRGNYWHSKTDPSSWLTASVVSHLSRKFKKLPRPKLIELAAQILNVDAANVESTLDWNANYTAWHDGGKPENYHVLPPE